MNMALNNAPPSALTLPALRVGRSFGSDILNNEETWKDTIMPFLPQVRIVVTLQEDGGGTARAAVSGTASRKGEDKRGAMLVEATISGGKAGLPAAMAARAAA